MLIHKKTISEKKEAPTPTSVYQVLYSQLIGSILLCLFCVTANAAAVIDLSVSNTNVNVGNSVEVNFGILGLTSAAGDSISGFDFDILFDSSVLSFTGASFNDPVLGNQLDLPEIGAFSFIGNATDIGSGILDVYALSGNSDFILDVDQANAFRFLTLTFKALVSTSSTNIGIDINDPFLLALDSGFNDLAVSYGAIDVNLAISEPSPNSVPEPSILALLALGAPIFRISRKNKITA